MIFLGCLSLKFVCIILFPFLFIYLLLRSFIWFVRARTVFNNRKTYVTNVLYSLFFFFQILFHSFNSHSLSSEWVIHISFYLGITAFLSPSLNLFLTVAKPYTAKKKELLMLHTFFFFLKNGHLFVWGVSSCALCNFTFLSFPFILTFAHYSHHRFNLSL